MSSKFISFGEAARLMLSSRKVTDIAEARRWLIAALIRGELSSWADSFWLWDSETTPDRPHHGGGEEGLPQEFWKMSHAQHADLTQIQFPSGASGDWKTSRFRYQIYSTANAARLVNPHYAHLDYLSSKIVCLEADAIDCCVGKMDVQRLIERGYARKLISNARGISSVKSGGLFDTVVFDHEDGHVSSISALEILAQFVARSLTSENQEEIREGNVTIRELLKLANPLLPDDIFGQLGALQEFERKVKSALLRMPQHAPD